MVADGGEWKFLRIATDGVVVRFCFEVLGGWVTFVAAITIIITRWSGRSLFVVG